MSDQVSFMELGIPMDDEERLLQAITPCLITALQQYGITATVRRTLGSDIDASCGQLRRRYEKEAANENAM